MKKFLKTAETDIPASIVVFLVALPLCLGVAVASDAAPITGIVAGVVGGIVVGIFSGSQLSVSGPAAGLTAIVASALSKLPSYEVFLVAVVLAGIFQILLGYAKAGFISDFIPNSVIKGMLAAIGLILILKQLPHLVGNDVNPQGDESFLQKDQENTFSEIIKSFSVFTPGAVIIGLVSIAILLLLDKESVKKWGVFTLLPGPLLVVVAGILINKIYSLFFPALCLTGTHLVQLEVFAKPKDFFYALPNPDFAKALDWNVLLIAITIAVVASIESLLSLEAVDKIDPQRRISPANRELKAQGIGNIVSGLLGGLPITSVIVRSSANVNAGGKTRLSTLFHGILLLLAVLYIPGLLNTIPLAALAAILILTGYKLSKFSLFVSYYRKGWDQFIPFIVTVFAILLTNLLAGIFIGILIGIFFVLRANHKSYVFSTKLEHRYARGFKRLAALFFALRSNRKSSIFTIKNQYRCLIRFREDVTFLNKANLKAQFAKIPDKTSVLIDASKTKFIDNDITDLVNDFIVNAETRGIRTYIKYEGGQSQNYFKELEAR